MQCPYCSRDMRSGYIKASGEILAWTPESEINPWTRWGISRNGVKLGSYSFFGGGKVKAYYCNECQKVIVNTR